MTFLLIFICTIIAIIALCVLGFAAYIAGNSLIERLERHMARRKTMTTSMSAQELRNKRLEIAAKRRLKILVDNRDLNRERVTPKIPFDWEGVQK